MPFSAGHLFTRVWVEVSGGGSSVGSSCECCWTCFGAGVGLPNVGLGLVLLPLGKVKGY